MIVLYAKESMLRAFAGPDRSIDVAINDLVTFVEASAALWTLRRLIAYQ